MGGYHQSYRKAAECSIKTSSGSQSCTRRMMVQRYKGTIERLLGLVGRKLEGMKKFWAGFVVIEYDCLVNCRIL